MDNNFHFITYIMLIIMTYIVEIYMTNLMLPKFKPKISSFGGKNTVKC